MRSARYADAYTAGMYFKETGQKSLRTCVCMVRAQLGPHFITRVYAEGIEGEESNSGATATVALVRRDKIVVANVGDSRAVVCRRCMPQPSKTRVPLISSYMRAAEACVAWMFQAAQLASQLPTCPMRTRAVSWIYNYGRGSGTARAA